MDGKLWIVGTVISAMAGLAGGCQCCNCECEDDGVEVARADVPAAVMATIEREAMGGKIGEIERETEDGKVVYVAEVTINGEEWEIEVAEDGKLIEKEREHDDDD